MSDSEFDMALVTAAFRLAGEEGWRNVNVAAAARAAGLSLAEAGTRFPSRAAILLRFGRLADQAALRDAAAEGPVRDRLFDLLMRRFDVLQAHRAGVKAVLRALPTNPPTALLLACATKRSMRWMLQAAGVTATVWAPVIVPVTVSVTVTVSAPPVRLTPAVLSVTGNVCTPASAAVNE